jgi:hypothetical protein
MSQSTRLAIALTMVGTEADISVFCLYLMYLCQRSYMWTESVAFALIFMAGSLMAGYQESMVTRQIRELGVQRPHPDPADSGA